MDTLLQDLRFGLLRIPLVRGRTFDERDESDATPVAMVSESFGMHCNPD